MLVLFFFFFSSRRRHTRFSRDWSSDVCSSDLPAIRDVHQDHRGIDKGVLTIELRGERAVFIPIGIIADRNGPLPRYPPGLLIQLFNGPYFCTSKGRNIVDVTAEVANLIEGVPCRHLHGDF